MDSLKEFLKKWNLEHLFAIFEEQKIDESLIEHLNDDQVNFLTSNIGDRIRLQRAISSIKSADNSEEPPQKIPRSEEAEITTIKDNNITLLATDQKNLNLTENNIPRNIPIIFVNDFDATPGPSKILQELNETNISQATTETLYTTDTSAASSDVVPIRSVGVQNSSLGPFDLQSFLKSDVLGEGLWVKGTKLGFSNSDRDKLAELLIKHLVNQYGKLTGEDFAILSSKIVSVFPREHMATYYVAPIPKTLSTKNVHEKARGKLVDKQRNLFYMVKKLKNNKTSNEAIEEETNNIQDIISQEAKDSQIWLRRNSEPLCEVLHHWKLSYPLRKNTQFNTIADFLSSWPILANPISSDLINYDFAHIHPMQENFDLDTEFQNFFQSVLNQRRSLLNPADNTILQLLDSDITTESRRAIQLYLLAPLIPPKGRTKVKKLHWKPSITEAREGMLLHVLSTGDIEKAKKDKINSMYSKGLTVQPYLIIVGPSLNNITQALVIIDQNTYPCNSVLEALDFCFKSYIALDAKYPFQTQHIWYLIQWIIYKYRAATDPKILFINDLLHP